jgi:hypothetical protein
VAIHFPPSSYYLKQIIEPRHENLTIKVDGYHKDFVKETKLLGAIIDNKLNFDPILKSNPSKKVYLAFNSENF